MKSNFGITPQTETRIMEKSKEKIRNKGRVEGTLKLIKFLNDYRTIAECANHVDIHRKSVHRYFNLLTQLGFEIEILVKYRHKYRIINLKEYFQDGNEM